MPLTAQSLGLLLFGHVGVSQFAAQPPGTDSYSDSLGREGLAAINGALQEIYGDPHTPAHVNTATAAVFLPAPVNVTFSATAGSATIASPTPADAFTAGATLRVAGSVCDYPLAGPTSLLFAWQGATGTVSGTLLHDAVALPAGTVAVMDPVLLDGRSRMLPAPDPLTLTRVRSPGTRNGTLDYGRPPGGLSGPDALVPAGVPVSYLVESVRDPASNALVHRLRVSPPPAAAHVVTFRARVQPRRVTLDDLGGDDVDPWITAGTQTQFFGLSDGWDELLLLPFALQRWTGSPLFKNQSVLPEIARQYAVARAALVSIRPQNRLGMQLGRGPY